MPSGSGSSAAALKRWLVNQVLLATPVPSVASGFAQGLVDLGLPIWRAHLSARTLHPEVEGYGLTWTRDGQRLLEEYEHGSFAQMAVDSSPIYDAVIAARAQARDATQTAKDSLVRMVRLRLDRGEGLNQYPILARFRAAGGTDYLCFVIPFANDGHIQQLVSGAAVTLTADRPGGFTDGDIEIIADLMPSFGAAVRAGADLAATRVVLGTYLGRDVGHRVLEGEIRRGSVEAISAAILVGDLRGFTALTDESPRDSLVGMLNDYLDCLIGPVESHGGQVLKFLGDGLLATFAFADHEPRAICAEAFAAATETLDRVEMLNAQRRHDGSPVSTLDLALHAGEVLYGNVGSQRRLDFTIIGPAVNEVARLEALCATLDVPLVASRRFVELLGAPERFRSLGTRQLRGVRIPVEVFTTP